MPAVDPVLSRSVAPASTRSLPGLAPGTQDDGAGAAKPPDDLMIIVGYHVPPGGNPSHVGVSSNDHRHADEGKLRVAPGLTKTRSRGPQRLRLRVLAGCIHLLRLRSGSPISQHRKQIEHSVGDACMIQMVDDHFGRRRLAALHRRRDPGRTSADPRMPTTHVALPCRV
jgi:hypothetical protein